MWDDKLLLSLGELGDFGLVPPAPLTQSLMIEWGGHRVPPHSLSDATSQAPFLDVQIQKRWDRPRDLFLVTSDVQETLGLLSSEHIRC